MENDSTKATALRAANDKLHRRAQRLEGIEARLARVRAGYERMIAWLYLDRWKERRGARMQFRIVYDALKRAGYPWGTPHPTRKNTWNGGASNAEAHELIDMLAADRDAHRARANDAERERDEARAALARVREERNRLVSYFDDCLSEIDDTSTDEYRRGQRRGYVDAATLIRRDIKP